MNEGTSTVNHLRDPCDLASEAIFNVMVFAITLGDQIVCSAQLTLYLLYILLYLTK